jgi:hypothetical protein
MSSTEARLLNRDAKRLVKRYLKGETQGDFAAEFKRVYELDPEFIYLNISHAMNFMRINLSMRIIALHSFGILYKVRLSSLY